MPDPPLGFTALFGYDARENAKSLVGPCSLLTIGMIAFEEIQ
jgi:hypothetical protein